jgi:uncharacterized membrane protein YciS (DUF1049 family)
MSTRIVTTVLNTAVGAAIANRAQLKEASAPLVGTGKAAVMVLWGTIWKTFLVQLAVGAIWVGLFVFTYLTTQSAFFASSTAVTMLTWFLAFVVVPMAVLISEVIRVRAKLLRHRKTVARAAAEQEVLEERMVRDAPQTSADTTITETLVVHEQV